MTKTRNAAALTGVLMIIGLGLSGCAGEAGDDSGIDAVGTWGDPSAENAAYLSLDADGGLTGSDGCNRLTGSWKLNPADQIQFEQVASTRMACEGVETPLEGLDVATISGDTMTVFGEADAQIATLERSSTEPQ
ncbi:META domain-containing protein [Agromyces silvae]|uniref:META domain-containing protein n=1 Tax=Agromyces silvae TaxID=3388266 RepID=UPI00280A55AB|nr:META domain-containing protein [Agromyces protaetiae]